VSLLKSFSWKRRKTTMLYLCCTGIFLKDNKIGMPMKHHTRSASYTFLLLLGICLFGSIAYAETTVKEMDILAVSQTSRDLYGSVAHLQLELSPGTGRIFIETYPLTKIDTQISARIAKEIACKTTEADCSKYDFIYTMRSGGPTIGGPSAGAAIAALTVAALDDLPVDKKVTVTGTIGSGGLVGSVGGILPKVQAAADAGLHTVMIPIGERYVLNTSQRPFNTTVQVPEDNDSIPENRSDTINTTDKDNISISFERIDVIAYGKERGVDVIEVSSLPEVIAKLTGADYRRSNETIDPPDYYDEIMGNLADELCERAEGLRMSIHADGNVTVGNRTVDITRYLDAGAELYTLSQAAYGAQQFYAAASYCYGAGLQYAQAELMLATPSEARDIFAKTLHEYEAYELPATETITDLQTHMLVQERLVEAADYLSQARSGLFEQNEFLFRANIALGRERFHSAISWSRFFDAPGKKFIERSQALRQACALRLREAQERQQYATIYIVDQGLVETDDLDEAVKRQEGEDYIMCIFYASKAKSYFDVITTSLGIEDETLTRQLEARMQVAHQEINGQIEDNVFPIAAFSYVQYAESLADSDVFSSLLYSQYGIELADINIYLNGAEFNGESIDYAELILGRPWQVFLLGLALGIIVAVVLLRVEMRMRATPHRKKSEE
jgi:uncharacterized protein